MSEIDWTEDGIVTCLTKALQPLGLAAEAMRPELSLSDDLGLDSFQMMQVARQLETAYAFRFSLADWALAEEDRDDQAYTIGSLKAFILAHVPVTP
ncbi:MAG: acyl carrier protein [Candidatus Sericytochromatia bacterium]|nr:acyl carrier protein [Candidatus Sericytochromatia bacterium]